MATPATGWQYWVLLEWRDAAGHNRLGSVQLGPFPAPSVPPGGTVQGPLHACAPTAPPAGTHAGIGSVPMEQGPAPS